MPDHLTSSPPTVHLHGMHVVMRMTVIAKDGCDQPEYRMPEMVTALVVQS